MPSFPPVQGENNVSVLNIIAEKEMLADTPALFTKSNLSC